MCLVLCHFFDKEVADGPEQVQTRVAALDEMDSVVLHMLGDDLVQLCVLLAHCKKIAKVHLVVCRSFILQQLAV